MEVMDSDSPELFIGLAAPIGTDLNCVEDEISSNLKSFGYSTVKISVSEIIGVLANYPPLAARLGVKTPVRTLREKIDAGNCIRSKLETPDILARAACLKIQTVRREAKLEKLASEKKTAMSDKEIAAFETTPIPATAYIVRQLKRPEEVKLLRQVYGPHFILISATSGQDKRLTRLQNEIGKIQIELDPKAREQEARNLVQDDSAQDDKEYGQLISETFHLADFFIDASVRTSVAREMQRFIRALFGSNRVSPTKDEYGSYFAKAASLKTVDMSRQVGAAIFTPHGDIVSMGCNDVAKAGGGHFWEEDEQKFRDIDLGSEANKEETSRIIFDFLHTLEKNNVLLGGKTAEGVISSPKIKEAISQSMIGEITEYGRMIHAEMSAITDAARLGRMVNDCTLYVTTYPCHNCAKHIVASGISRVVYIEPYPKSRAGQLYAHAISEYRAAGTVSFEHFFGISPRLYTAIFEKSKKRRDGEGKVREWAEGGPKPMIRKQDYDLAERDAATSFMSLIGDDTADSSVEKKERTPPPQVGSSDA